MKKNARNYLVLLFSVLFACTLFTACSKKDEETTPSETTITTTATATPTPVNEVIVALEKLKTTIGEQSSLLTSGIDVSNGIGFDGVLDLTINSEVTNSLGLYGLSTAGINFSMDYKDALSFFADVSLNQEKIATLVAYMDDNGLYFNLPAYSKTFAAMDFEALEETLPEGELPAIPKLSDISSFNIPPVDYTAILNNFITQFVANATLEAGESSVTIGTDVAPLPSAYRFTGEKSSVSITGEKLNSLLQNLMAELNTGLVTDADALISDTTERFYLNFYKGSNKESAYELIVKDTEGTRSIVLVFTEKGFCCYSVENSDAPQIFAYSVRESANSGKILFAVDEMQDMTIEYENYSKDGCDLYLETSDISASFGFHKISENKISYSLSVIAAGTEINGFYDFDTASKKMSGEFSIRLLGLNVATMTFSGTYRDYKPAAAPTNAVDLDTWAAYLDTDALMADLTALMMKYPALADLILGE